MILQVFFASLSTLQIGPALLQPMEQVFTDLPDISGTH